MKYVMAILCGLPGSGKSEFLSKYKKEETSYNVIDVSYDRIIPSNSDLEKESWKSRRKNILKSVESLLRGENPPNASFFNVNVLPSRNECIIFIDDNNYLSSMRYEYFKICRNSEIGFCQFEIKVPLEVSLRRNRISRPKNDSVSDNVIQRMNEKFESPNPLKNEWEKYSFSLNGEVNPNFETVNAVLSAAMNDPVYDIRPQIEAKANASRAACDSNVIHQADNLLRKKLNNMMTDLRSKEGISGEEIGCKVKTFNEAKSEILEDLRTGHTMLSPTIINNMAKKEHKKRAIQDLNCVLEELVKLKLQW